MGIPVGVWVQWHSPGTRWLVWGFFFFVRWFRWLLLFGNGWVVSKRQRELHWFRNAMPCDKLADVLACFFLVVYSFMAKRQYIGFCWL